MTISSESSIDAKWGFVGFFSRNDYMIWNHIYTSLVIPDTYEKVILNFCGCQYIGKFC